MQCHFSKEAQNKLYPAGLTVKQISTKLFLANATIKKSFIEFHGNPFDKKIESVEMEHKSIENISFKNRLKMFHSKIKIFSF